MTKNKKNETAAEWVDLENLRPWADNPRVNSHAIDSVANSIKRFGFASPIIARMDGEIIAGHTRYQAAKRLKLDRVPVRYLDLDPADARLLALADNKVGEIADWDDEKLVDVMRALDAEGADLEGLGWGDDEIEEMLTDVLEEPVKPDIVFSEFLDESNNYVVLAFKSDIDWLSAMTHFELSTRHSKRQNGKPWSAGIGRVIDGAKYLEELKDNA